MHLGDTIFIFCLALIIFGPKKLPEIGRQIGKLMLEFRRASNEFKMQIEEELRASEQADRQKEITAAAALASPAVSETALITAGSEADASPAIPALSEATIPTIAPPSTGLPVNHTFPDQSASVETAEDSEDAYPEPPSGFNPALNTASNGISPETAASEPVEPAPPSEVLLAEPEIAPAATHHG